jgi:hypothetical protein
VSKYARPCVREFSAKFVRPLESKPDPCRNWIQASAVQRLDFLHSLVREVDGLGVSARRRKEMVQDEKTEIDLGFGHSLRRYFGRGRGVNFHRFVLSR